MLLLHLMLVLVPVAGNLWARGKYPRRITAITGVATGLIISPFGSGLYMLAGFATAYIHPVAGAFPLLLAFLILGFQAPAGYKIAVMLGIQEPATTIEGLGYLWIEIINGIVWGTVYGALGYVVDNVRARAATTPARRKEDEE